LEEAFCSKEGLDTRFGPSVGMATAVLMEVDEETTIVDTTEVTVDD